MNPEDPRVLRVASALVALITELQPKSSPAPAPGPTYYTANKRGPHPPGKSPRWCRDNFPEIPGAVKVGRDWTVSIAGFDAWLATKNAKRSPARVVVGPWSPEAALEAAGVRAQRAGGSR